MADMTPTKKAVLEKAKEHFLCDGFKSASLRQIVKEAGFTQGAFYGYYDSKEELFCDLVKETAEGIERILLSISAEMDEYPAETRMLHMSECYMNRLPELVDFLYAHHDELILLLKRAEGTRYENFLGQMQQLSETHTARRINTSPMPLPIHPMALKALMDAYYTAVFGILLADLPRDDTLRAMLDLQRFYQGGLEAIVSTERGTDAK